MELKRRLSGPAYVTDGLFKEQRRFLFNPARYKVAFNTRRSGKSYLAASALFHFAGSCPNTQSVYIALTRDSARRILWPILEKLDKDYAIKAELLESSLTVKLPNGSSFFIVGADQKNFISRLLGVPYRVAIIDECFHADTLVDTPAGPKPIYDLRVGDPVLNAVGVGIITNISTKDIVGRIELTYGNKSVVCSANHPFFTSRGWVNAEDLKEGDLLANQDFCLRILQSNDDKDQIPKTEGRSILFEQLRSEVCPKKPAQPVKNEPEQSNEKGIRSFTGIKDTKENEVEAANSWWEWAWPDRIRESFNGIVSRHYMELCNRIITCSKRISEELQSRLGVATSETSNRSRRHVSSYAIQKKAGYKEGQNADFTRLDSIKILEQGDFTKYRRSLFYDLSVSGHPSYSINGALVHNCQNFRDHVEDLIDEVLTPSMMDYDGEIWMLGTPGPIPAGYFYDVTVGDKQGWLVNKWTLFNNPYLPKAEQFLEELLKRKGWTRAHPTFRRQYLGEWVIDTDALLYKFDHKVNTVSELPQSKAITRVLGMDFGYEDATAWVVISWTNDSKELFVEYAFKKSGMIPTEIAETTRKLVEQFAPVKIVADTGGLGKSIAEELRRRHSIPVHAAEKKDKATYIQLVNDDLISGKLKLKASLSNLINELQLITRGEDGLEEPDCVCDLCFVAGTLVETDIGPKPIELIQVGDFVWTRNGLRSVLASAQTSKSSEVIELEFSNGATIRCTPQHKIMTNRGYVMAKDALLYSDRFISFEQCEKLSFLMGQVSIDTQNQNMRTTENIIEAGGVGNMYIFIGRFGFLVMEKFLQAIVSIIKTATRLIMTYRTSSAWTARCTCLGILPKGLRTQSKEQKTIDCSTELDRLPKNGTVQPRVTNGIRGRLVTLKKKIGKELGKPALFVRRIITQTGFARTDLMQNLFALQNVLQNNEGIQGSITQQAPAQYAKECLSTTNTPKEFFAVTLVQRRSITGREAVYDITVDGEHQFFANRILVSNCDALLYAHREATHWTHQAKRKISRDSDEYMDEQLEKEAKSHQNETDWWEKLDASKDAW